MSKTIDQRVVEMQFDNRQFERNVSTTMSTLAKLKRSLNLDNAAKGLGDISTAAKKVDMTGLANSVETVRAKFSALDVIGVTALANITNSAVNAAKRIASALTIDPIKTGFQEYETQINAVQTILANTESKGTTIKDVNRALEELNTYADKTIYNFTEMTRNIGTFTAAGIDLDTSVNAIQGIANLAAVSGSTSQQASTAMYQLSQALASGTVKLMDWNSVVNAGMGGQVFQDALKETARVHGVAIDSMIEEQGSFRETLKDGWLTADILTETLSKFTMATEDATEAEIAANREKLRSMGYTEEQIEGIFKLGNTATNAATKVKTFTQLWDVMKESAQSGWAQTWKILVGDFEEAKALLTPIADFFTGVINKVSEARNTLLESALGKGFSHMLKGLGTMLDTTKDGVEAVMEPIGKVTEGLEDLGSIVDNVLLGKFGTGKDRFDALTDAGYNYYRVQNKVNEALGNSFRHSEETIAAQDQLLGKTQKSIAQTKEQASGTAELTEARKQNLKTLVKMTDAQLLANGYSEKQIGILRQLASEAEKLGLSTDEFVDNLDQINGRWVLINSFKNISQGLVAVFTAIGEAWRDIFDPITSEQLYNVIAGIHKLTTSMTVNEEAAENFRRTFRGVFAALDIILTIVGGPIKIAFKAFTQLLGMFNLDLLGFTALVGDAIVGFRDWIDSTLDFTKIFELVIPIVQKAASVVSGWFEKIKESEIVQDLIQGFVDGLKGGVAKVWSAVVEFATNIITAAKEVLGIHSPSTVFFEIGQNIIEGLVNGVMFAIRWVIESAVNLATTFKEAFAKVDLSGIFTAGADFGSKFADGVTSAGSKVWGVISGVVSKIGEFFNGIDFGTLTAGAFSGGMLFLFLKIAKVLETLAKPFDAIGDILKGFSDIGNAVTKTVKAFTGVLKSFSLSIKAKALKDIAIAIAILVGSIALLTFLDPTRLQGAVEVIVTLGLVLAGLSFVVGKVGSVTGGIGEMVKGLTNIAKIAGLILAVGVSMLLLAAVVKIIAGMSWGEMGKAAVGIIFLGGIITGLIAATKLAGKDIDKVGSTILKISAAMLLLVGVAKLIASMSWGEMGKAGAGMLGLGLIIAGLIAATKLAGKDIDKVGGTILKIGVAMLLLAAVCKIIAGMTWFELGKAAAGIAGFAVIVLALIGMSKLAGKDIDKVGSTILKIGVAMLLLTAVCKIIAGMSWGEMGKAAVGIIFLGGVITGLIAATRLASDKELKRIGSTLLTMSISIGILGLVAAMLGLMNLGHLAKGVIAVGVLSAMMALMIAATRGASDCKGNIMWMTIAIAAMAASAIALSMIDTVKLLGATAALSVMMGMFALMTKAAGGAGKSVGTIIVLALTVGLLAVILKQLTTIPIKEALASAGVLSMLMIAMSIMLLAVSHAGKNSGGALTGAIAMIAMLIPLAACVGLLAIMQNIQNATKNAIALTAMVTALSLMLIPLTIVGSMGPAAFIGILALTAMAVPLVAFVGVLALMNGIKNASDNAKLMTRVLTAMTLLLIPLTVIGAFGGAAAVGIASLLGIIVAFGTVVLAVGALMEHFPELEDFVNRGLGVLEKLAFGLGSVIGNLVSGFLDGITDKLPKIGADLSMFMVNVTPFIAGAQMIKPEALKGVQTLVDVILALSAANIVESLASWLTGGSSFAKFAEELVPFGEAMAKFSETVAGINQEAVLAAANAGKILAEMADALPNSGGVLGFFAGENDMATFGTQLVSFGEAMAKFSKTVAGNVSEEVVISAANAGKALIEVANAVPNAGGVAAFFAGDNTMDTFGTQLVSFGEAMVKFSETVAGNISEDAITGAVNAGKIMLELADALPNSGGVLGFFAGNNDLNTFGTQILSFGESMVAFSEKVSGNIDGSAVSATISAANMFSVLANSLPKSGGFASLFSADNDMSTFGKELEKFGQSMAKFSEKIIDVDNSQISATISQFNKIVAMAYNMSCIDMDAFGSFGDALGSLGKAGVDKFVKAFDGADIKVQKAVNSMVSGMAAGFKMETGGLGEAVVDMIDKLIKKIEKSMSTFKATGSKFMLNLAKGVSAETAQIKAAINVATEAAITAFRGHYNEFIAAGAYLTTGFAVGISVNSFKAADKARAMARKAVEAAKDELDINSPSRVAYGIGEFYGLGFVNALDDYAKVAYSAGANIGDYARKGLTKAVRKIGDYISSDLDVQPTIRPVLDLSEVKAGAGVIDGLLGSGASVGIASNIGAISSMMAMRGQNGTNADVVSAIDKLRRDLGNVGNTTYQINGVTYDDGSNVSDAVRTLVRAAKIERRV